MSDEAIDTDELTGSAARLAKLSRGKLVMAAQVGNIAIDAVLADIKTVLSALPKPKTQIDFAYCCGQQAKYCDCVKKDHGKAWIDTLDTTKAQP